MADQADIEADLAAIVERVRVEQGATWAVLRGWPDSAALDRLLAAGRVAVTISPRQGYVSNTTRYLGQTEHVTGLVPQGITLAAAGQTVTLSGTPSAAEIVSIESGPPHIYSSVRPALGDTLAIVASALVQGVPGTSAAGPTLTVPGLILGRVTPDALAQREVRRTQQQFQVIVWAPTPALRDEVAALLDGALSDIAFLGEARLRFVDQRTTDTSQNASLYRRDLIYSAEYPTTLRRNAPRVVFPSATLIGGVGVPSDQAPLHVFSRAAVTVGTDGATAPASSSSVETTLLAGAAISGHRGLMPDGRGGVIHADPNSPLFTFLGISLSSAGGGAVVRVCDAGRVVEPSWTWTAGDPLYALAGGMLSQIAPTTGTLQQIGVALTPTEILVQPFPPVALN